MRKVSRGCIYRRPKIIITNTTSCKSLVDFSIFLMRQSAIIRRTFERAQVKSQDKLEFIERKDLSDKKLILLKNKHEQELLNKLTSSQDTKVIFKVGGKDSWGYGRYYPLLDSVSDGDSAKVRSPCAIGVPKWLRAFIYRTHNHYLDLKNAAPTIEEQLCRALDIEPPQNLLNLRSFLVSCLENCGQSNATAKKIAKMLINGMLNGMGERGIMIHKDIPENLKKPIIELTNDFRKQIKKTREDIISFVDKNFKDDLIKSGKQVVPIIIQSIERIVVETAMKYMIEKKGRKVTSYMNDGFLLLKLVADEELSQELLQSLNEAVFQSTGFRLEFVEEIMELDETRMIKNVPQQLPIQIFTAIQETLNLPGFVINRSDVQMDNLNICLTGVKRGHAEAFGDVKDCTCEERQITFDVAKPEVIVTCNEDSCKMVGSQRILSTNIIDKLGSETLLQCLKNAKQINIQQNYYNQTYIDDSACVNPTDKEFFQKSFYFVEDEKVVVEIITGIKHSRAEFENMFPTRITKWQDPLSKQYRQESSAKLIMRRGELPVYSAWTWQPGKPETIKHPNPERPLMLNTWKSSGMKASSLGSCEKFNRLLSMCFHHKEENVIFVKRIFAWLVQFPHLKPHWFFQICGKQGSGKSLIVETFCKVICGESDNNGLFIKIDGKEDGQMGQQTFNSHIMKKRLILIDELNGMKPNMYEYIKLKVRSTHQLCRQMYDGYKSIKNDISMWLFTGNQIPVPITDTECRDVIGYNINPEYCYDFWKDEELKKKERSDYFQAVLDELDNGGMQRLKYELENMDLTQEDGTKFDLQGEKIIFPEYFKTWIEENTPRSYGKNALFDQYLSDIQKNCWEQNEIKKEIVDLDESKPFDACAIHRFSWKTLVKEGKIGWKPLDEMYDDLQKWQDSSLKNFVGKGQFSKKLARVGLLKAQKRINKSTGQVVMVGFKLSDDFAQREAYLK